MTEKFKYEGIVSSGTLRPEDLIPIFMEVLKELNPTSASFYGTAADRDGWERRIQDNDELDMLLGDLIADLDIEAPKGYYFGTHPGDGADFGFWKDEDA